MSDTTTTTTADTTATTAAATTKAADTTTAATILTADTSTKTADTTTTTTAPVQAKWPDDWRSQLAAADEKEAKRLERFGSPADVWKSYRAMEQRQSSGEFVRKPPAPDAAPDVVAAWRKETGIPEKPEGYYEKLPDGLVVGDEDKKLIDIFAAAIHDKNASPDVFAATISTYYKIQEVVNAERAEDDAKAQQNTEDTLRVEWGNDYRRNVGAITNWLSATFDNDSKELIANARLMDGTPLFSNPKIVQALFRTAMDINPAGTLVPGAGASAGANIETRIAELTAMMGNRNSAYWKDEKLQAEFRTLVEARDAMKARAA